MEGSGEEVAERASPLLPARAATRDRVNAANNHTKREETLMRVRIFGELWVIAKRLWGEDTDSHFENKAPGLRSRDIQWQSTSSLPVVSAAARR
jgi:hypothetical protein